jgi:hypothetical protein
MKGADNWCPFLFSLPSMLTQFLQTTSIGNSRMFLELGCWKLVLTFEQC